MRLRDATLWALGASLVKAASGPGGTSIGGQPPAGITFNESDFVADDVNLGINAIFNGAGRNGADHNFNFQSTAQIIVNDVWVMRQGGSPVAHGTTSVPVVQQSPSVESGNAKVDASLPSIRITTTTTPSGTSGQLTFNLYNFIPSVVAQPLFLQIDWARGTTTGGVTTSRVFAIANQNANRIEMEALVARFAGQLSNTTAAVAEVQPATSTTPDGTSPTSPSGGITTTSPSTGSSTSTPSSTSSPLAASAPSGTGLAVGAIAGIAVACGVVGIALVALLAFFLIRRNRRRAGTAPYSNGRAHRTADLIAEKEATAGVTESPHSPYSDDGHGGTSGAAMLAGHHGHHQQGQHQQGVHSETASFAPYSDGRHTPGVRESVALESEAGTEHMSGASTAVARGGDRGGASTQMSGRYAHLMEEGMTPEERARIEEEERHLDAAIEQAAPRR